MEKSSTEKNAIGKLEKITNRQNTNDDLALDSRHSHDSHLYLDLRSSRQAEPAVGTLSKSSVTYKDLWTLMLSTTPV
jgi:hypothetical protein